jgi:hypothetical protein
VRHLRRCATDRYRRVYGTADEKLRAMRAVLETGAPLAGDWVNAPTGWRDPFVPQTGGAAWTDMPLVTDLFPWQQPRCKFGRTWPIAPSPELLGRRWARFAAAPRAEKPALFMTATSGRNIQTKVDSLPKLSDSVAGTSHRPIARYGCRSFDRQWAFNDPRMAKTDSPSLWQSSSSRQLYFSSLLTGHISEGPALTLTADVPDLHFFRGSFGGKDIIPLYRDAAARELNITAGLPGLLGERIGID